MTLIKSISGIRGTIGGFPGNNLTPLDVVKYASAYGMWLKSSSKGKIKVVVGRDARISGLLVQNLVESSLQSLGINVIDIGLSTTPTVEIAVPIEKASGGIILTASHNPKQWNALKLLNEKGEFVSAKDGNEILRIAEKDNSREYRPKLTHKLFKLNPLASGDSKGPLSLSMGHRIEYRNYETAGTDDYWRYRTITRMTKMKIVIFQMISKIVIFIVKIIYIFVNLSKISSIHH